ncbi:MAG TPA: DUF4389 domain-containing protein [Solirubrobacterales bacterium]|nr:DUF4389 domain-containing protein [Solirubrobacterales bacterium]
MYPVQYEADFNPEPNRWTTFFRPLLAIPWIIVAAFWGILFIFTHLFAWVAVVILGRYPHWLYEFNSGVIRFGVRTGAWIYLQTDEWPPFGLSDDPNYPIRVNIAPAAASQSRLKAFFRLLLALPMLIVSYAVNYMHVWVAAIAWLTIVFRGYQPEGVNNALTFVNSFYARLYGYVAILTDDYPPIGEEKANASGATPAPVSPNV